MKSVRKNMKNRDGKLLKEMMLGDPDYQRKSEIRAIDDAVMKDLAKKKVHKPLTMNERMLFTT